VVAGAVSISGAGGIPSAEAFGILTISRGGVTVSGAGAIASGEAFGAFTVTQAGVTITDAGNIPSAEAFGTLIVSVGGVVVSGVGDIGSEEAFGVLTIEGGAGNDLPLEGALIQQVAGEARVLRVQTEQRRGRAQAQPAARVAADGRLVMVADEERVQ
jgi:hypothetical protein